MARTISPDEAMYRLAFDQADATEALHRVFASCRRALLSGVPVEVVAEAMRCDVETLRTDLARWHPGRRKGRST